MNKKVKNVVFDLGGVLLEWDVDKIVSAVFDDPEKKKTVKREVFEHGNWMDLDRGTLDGDKALLLFSERTGRSIEEIKRLMNLVREILAPLPESMALLYELEKMGVPLYCLSNMHVKSWSRFDFWDKFRGIVISSELKMAKPEPEIYEYLLTRYALEPCATVFIDDNRENIEAARRAGMKGILFQSAKDCREKLMSLLGINCL